MIGWHVNRGKDKEADFFSIARFRDDYYRPDVINQILKTFNPDEALRLANLARGEPMLKTRSVSNLLPPIVKLISPSDGNTFDQTEIEIRYQVRGTRGKTVELRMEIDGSLLSTMRGGKPLQSSETSNTLRVTLPQKNVRLSLIAITDDGRASEAAIANLKWVGSEQITQTFTTKPKLYVLAVGVSDYENNENINDLDFAHKDAQDFVNLLKTQTGKGLYHDVTSKLLTNATRSEILSGLEWIENQTIKKNDVIMVLFAGHGVNDKIGRYYFLPSDVNAEQLRSTALPHSELKETMVVLARIGKVLFFIDTCHSGNLMGGHLNIADVNMVANDLSSSKNGIIVLTASTGNQLSQENSEWKNGAFTKSLLEGLNGKASNKKGQITVKGLDYYISTRVAELTDDRQTPTSATPKAIPDFPIAAIRK